MHRQPASYSFAKLEIVADVCFSAVLRSCVFKNVICSGVCNFTLKKNISSAFPLWQSRYCSFDTKFRFRLEAAPEELL